MSFNPNVMKKCKFPQVSAAISYYEFLQEAKHEMLVFFLVKIMPTYDLNWFSNFSTK